MFASRKGGVVFLSWLSVFLWMGLIFYMSARPGDDSVQMSSSFLSLFEAFFPFMDEDALHYMVRKFAHLAEYMILVILLVNALRQHISQKMVKYRLAGLLSLAYAVSDEVHQSFVPGRNGSILDVLIDGLGIMLGLLLFELFVQVFQPVDELD